MSAGSRFPALLFCLCLCITRVLAEPPLAEGGVLDLRTYPNSRTEIIPLTGTWQFHWQRFIDPVRPPSVGRVVTVPGNWQPFTGDPLLFPRQFGYASYRLRILLPQSGQIWALYLPPIRTAYRLYLNGKLLTEVGQPTADDSDQPASAVRLVSFTTSGPTADLILHVSNHNFSLGGVWAPLRLGSPDLLQKQLLLRIIFTIFISTLLFTIGLYHLFLFGLRRKEKAFLYFGLFALIASLRQLFDGHNLFFTLFEALNWHFSFTLLYSLFPVGTILFVLYLRAMFPNQRLPLWERLVIGLNAFHLLLYLLTPASFYTRTVFIADIAVIPQFFYLLYISYQAWQDDVEDAGLIWWGLVLFGLCVVYDIALFYLQADAPYLIATGIALFACCQAWLLAGRFSRSTAKAETLQTELQTANEQMTDLDRKRQEAEQQTAIQEVQNRFLSNITHEFRTPLSLIVAPVNELMNDPSVPDSRQALLQTILRNAQQLQHLVNQSLDLAKLDARSMTSQVHWGDLAQFLEEIVASFRVMAGQRQIELRFVRNTDRFEGMVDADKLGKIVNNLLSNAINYTPAGGQITVEFSGSDAVEGVRFCTLQVSNTGDGIPPEALPHVFERFYQVSSANSSYQFGTGIGLALVKELTEFLGGTIRVSSVHNLTTFTFHCPIRQADESQPDTSHPGSQPPETPATTVSRKNSPVVLVVEDNSELRSLIVRVLTRNYRVLSAPNGKVGWQMCERELPDLVVSDVMMPEMDGLTLCRTIRETPATQHIAVMLLTARTGQDSRLEGLSTGANDYLAKPFDLRELALRVDNLLQHQQRQREHYLRQLLPSGHPPVMEPTAPDTAFIQQVHQVLAAELSNSAFGVEQLAQALAMSSKTLNRRLTTLAGLTANELIRTYRLRKATELLRTGHSVSETAYLTGFESPSYFSRCFKEEFAVSPSDFLRNATEADTTQPFPG